MTGLSPDQQTLVKGVEVLEDDWVLAKRNILNGTEPVTELALVGGVLVPRWAEMQGLTQDHPALLRSYSETVVEEKDLLEQRWPGILKSDKKIWSVLRKCNEQRDANRAKRMGYGFRLLLHDDAERVGQLTARPDQVLQLRAGGWVHSDNGDTQEILVELHISGGMFDRRQLAWRGYRGMPKKGDRINADVTIVAPPRPGVYMLSGHGCLPRLDVRGVAPEIGGSDARGVIGQRPEYPDSFVAWLRVIADD